MEEPTKICPCCGVLKTHKEFGTRQRSDKLQSWCRKCRSKGHSKARIDTEREQGGSMHWSEIAHYEGDKLMQAAMQTPEQIERLKVFCKESAGVDTVTLPAGGARLREGIELKPRSMGLSTLSLALYSNDRDRVLEHYLAMYPNDKAGPHRSIKFMKDKLLKRLNRGK